MSEFTKPCEYCGTLLNDNGEQESSVAACGPRMTHYASTCREYVHAALRCYQRDLAAAKVRIAELEAELRRQQAAVQSYVGSG